MAGSITTTPPIIELPPGSSPSSIAKGDVGATGPSNVLTIGSVVQGGSAAATITGASPSQILNLTLPQGPAGPTGPTGPSGAVGVSGTPTVNQFATWLNSTTTQGVSITGLVKGNGATAPSAASAGTDYLAPPSGTALLKANSGGALANAVASTDYAPATSGSAILKGNGSGGFSSAAAGTDYAAATSGSGILKGNGSGGTTVATGPDIVTLGAMTQDIEFIIDGGGSAITTGVKGDLEIPFACTIQRATLLADQSGSIVVDIFKCSYANYDGGSTHPVSGDKITASAPPTISTATKAQDSTLTGWTTSITAGDILRFNVNSITTCTRVTLALKVLRTGQ